VAGEPKKNILHGDPIGLEFEIGGATLNASTRGGVFQMAIHDFLSQGQGALEQLLHSGQVLFDALIGKLGIWLPPAHGCDVFLLENLACGANVPLEVTTTTTEMRPEREQLL